MGTNNNFGKSQMLTIAGGIVSIVSVFLPWFSASTSMLGRTSSMSVNGLGWKSGNDILGLLGGKMDWQFQGIGVLALGIACIIIAVILRERFQSIAMLVCGILIIGGGVVNLQSINTISAEILGATVQWGVGYGLYVVVLGGAIASAGGLLKWQELNS